MALSVSQEPQPEHPSRVAKLLLIQSCERQSLLRQAVPSEMLVSLQQWRVQTRTLEAIQA